MCIRDRTIVKDASNLNLKSLKINGYALNEVFDYNTLHYTASIPYEVDTITVAATPIDNAANVDITGLTNLKVGENTVTITVSDKAGNSKKYTIVVTRESEKSVSTMVDVYKRQLLQYLIKQEIVRNIPLL